VQARSSGLSLSQPPERGLNSIKLNALQCLICGAVALSKAEEVRKYWLSSTFNLPSKIIFSKPTSENGTDLIH
jgi:hypothetical protein